MLTVEEKRKNEMVIVSQMIDIYCHHKHHTKGLCKECQELKEYALERTRLCPFMETKTFCSNCKVHCYRSDMKERIRCVMRYSGPWLLLYHPIKVIQHVYYFHIKKK